MTWLNMTWSHWPCLRILLTSYKKLLPSKEPTHPLKKKKCQITSRYRLSLSANISDFNMILSVDLQHYRKKRRVRISPLIMEAAQMEMNRKQWRPKIPKFMNHKNEPKNFRLKSEIPLATDCDTWAMQFGITSKIFVVVRGAPPYFL